MGRVRRVDVEGGEGCQLPRKRVPDTLLPSLEVQIYELGNSLGFISEKQLPPVLNDTPGPDDNEPGAKLYHCYYGKYTWE
jgi:hypothetical protein